MKKSTKVGITFTILTVLVLGIGIVFAILVNKEKTMLENIQIIRQTFSNFNADLIDIYQIRAGLVEKLDTFNEETYKEEHESYVEILTSYNNEITSLNNNIAILEDKCSLNIDDAETRIFCTCYQQLYEGANNLYVKQLTRYNELITSYNENEENEKDYEQYGLINKELIDFDQNGIYEGGTE